jgi:hypothetical protein
MNVEIGTEAPIFLFGEYLLPIFCIFSLQCSVIDTGDAMKQLQQYQLAYTSKRTLKVLSSEMDPAEIRLIR